MSFQKSVKIEGNFLHLSLGLADTLSSAGLTCQSDFW